ncbi:MAG: NUDIX domain-containing protein [Rhodoferax sp.]|uniref:NUDIX hydrolase n=1 Tax=Rhodoferax sp. TaxID=50421 RepID=UPI002638BB06|nr:NUDIX domain-containing protein [Rhodoferax sp.]MDD5335958.1 NUDIX domain-containing protein [Rhodoferax sp.]
MSAAELDPRWLAALHASADQPPWRPRLPLRWGPHLIGSVEPGYFSQAVLQHPLLTPERLQREEDSAGSCWRLQGDPTRALAGLAEALFEARVGRVVQQWRDEQLAVCDALGRQIATVERGVVRPLGIVTRAVHLVGRTAEGRFWVQQRALDKADDPGLWDTLMGGMVSAADSVLTALARETWEEAGLHLEAVEELRRGGSVTLRKPSSDRSDAGYVVEQVDWFACTVPQGVAPVNQDREVLQFALLDRAALLDKLQRNEFTTEAALILVAALRLP